MGMYDQLLSVTQQGLDRNNQIAMTSAQQPTMADVFMDRFRQGGQDRMAAQKMQSDMAMNEAYKNAQMQQMKSTADWHKRQRDLELANYISKTKTDANGPDVEAFVRSQGGSPDMIPKLRYEDVPYQVESAPAFAGGSISEGGEDTETTEMGKMPVRWSDWGNEAANQEKNRDLKLRLAEMSQQTKSYLASIKANDAKSAVGKIMQDLKNGVIKQELANDALMKATIWFDPSNAAMIGQGLNPAGSGLPIMQYRQTQGATQLPQGAPGQPQMPQPAMPQPQQPLQPALPTAPVAKSPIKPVAPVAPQAPPKKVTPFDGGKAAVAAAEERESLKDVVSKFGAMDKYISDNIVGHRAYESVKTPKGAAMTLIPKTDEYGFADNLKVLKNQIMLAALDALRVASKTGASGMGNLSNQEGDTLRNSMAALSLMSKKEDIEKGIATIQGSIKRIMDFAKSKMEAMDKARGVEAPKQAITLDEYLAAQRK